jgi:hypothetical protein
MKKPRNWICELSCTDLPAVANDFAAKSTPEFLIVSNLSGHTTFTRNKLPNGAIRFPLQSRHATQLLADVS